MQFLFESYTNFVKPGVDPHCEGSATKKNSPSSSLSRHCLIHEFGDLDMPLAVAQLGHVQEHPQELQWTLSSPVELQWNLNRAPVRMELKFSSGTPGNPLHLHSISGSTRLLVLDHQLGLCGISLTHPPVLQLPSYLKQRSYVDIVFQWCPCACAVVLALRLRSLASLIACGLVTVVLLTSNFDLISSSSTF